jgi:hypothetical protein
MMMRRIHLLLAFALMFGAGVLFAQNGSDDVHLFENFFRDATIAGAMYGEGGLVYDSYDGGNVLSLGAQGGYPIMPDLELNAALSFMSYSPDAGDGTSGISDLLVSGRYNVVPENTRISVGGYVTLPIGSEKLFGQNSLDFGAFGAARHPLDNGMVVTGTLGLDFYEAKTITVGDYKIVNGQVVYDTKEETDHETSLALGGGLIYPHSEQLNFVGEAVLHTKGDYFLISGGADYKLQSGGRVRGSLGIGLDSGAPDFSLSLSYLMPLK